MYSQKAERYRAEDPGNIYIYEHGDEVGYIKG